MPHYNDVFELKSAIGDEDSYYIGSHAYLEKYTSRPHAYLGYYENEGNRISAVIGKRWITKDMSSMIGFGIENANRTSISHPDTGASVESSGSSSLLHIEAKIGMMF